MKTLFTLGALALTMAVSAQSGNLKPGTTAPAFNLKNVNGEQVSFASFKEAKGYIVVFTCNGCPVAKKYEKRIIELNNKYAPLGYPVIAINTNDPELSPGDSFEAMVEKSKSNKYPFPYLFDKDGVVTTAYGARATPTLFLVKRDQGKDVIVYTGAIDNDPDSEKSDRVNYVDQAISAVQAGREPAISSTKAIGCSVKRKSST